MACCWQSSFDFEINIQQFLYTCSLTDWLLLLLLFCFETKLLHSSYFSFQCCLTTSIYFHFFNYLWLTTRFLILCVHLFWILRFNISKQASICIVEIISNLTYQCYWIDSPTAIFLLCTHTHNSYRSFVRSLLKMLQSNFNGNVADRAMNFVSIW